MNMACVIPFPLQNFHRMFQQYDASVWATFQSRAAFTFVDINHPTLKPILRIVFRKHANIQTLI